ncbi:MAG: HlyD family efflux transporter periplasmic adaptor subunit [Candidatus Choladocola sp.]|nr:HlyD family efflux transporter periplasmic adaptor subunit [Candidatus Choladocola sp.]
MIRGKRKKKITKYRRYSFFNIGTLLFGTVFIYMIISTFMYLTETHVTAYEVRKGTITGNYRYQALALRSETVVNASQSGSVRYYVREGAKVSAGSTVCSINETGSQEPVSISDFSLDSDDAKRLQNTLSSFTINFKESAFQKTYDLKSSVENTISEILEENSGGYISSRNQCIAPESGFVVYRIDGYEDVTENEINSDMFDQSSYHAENLRNQKSVTAGSPLFKEITSEEWALYFPIDSKLLTELSDNTKIRFRFLKDNVTFTAPFSIVTNGEESFGKISLDSSLVRYATDRYLEIELVMNKKSGLKIPSVSIVDRTFYKIPEEYAITNKDTEQEIVLKTEHFKDDGSSEIKYVTAQVYKHKDGYYLVDQKLLTEGDYIQLEDSAKRIQIQEKDVEVLHGVYNINKGYAVFREVTVIDENEEYCIVESNNIYGLAAYDYIVLNASEVTEEQIVY